MKLFSKLMQNLQENTNAAKSMAGEQRKVNLNTDSGLSMKKGGSVSSASKRADGCAVRGKTKA